MKALLLLPLVSVFIAPWWITVALAILGIMLPYGWVAALGAAILLDATYGAPLNTLGGTVHLYTLGIGIAVLVSAVLGDRVMDYDA
jgi:hypothetical protein